MKKVNGVLLSLLVVSLAIIVNLVLPPWLGDFSVKTKPVTSIIELNTILRGSGIEVPQFSADDDPYAYVSTQEYNLTRTRQKGKWDGYYIRIVPTKLSASHFHEILILANTTEDFTDRPLVWDVQDMTPYLRGHENLPPGPYQKIIGRYQQGPIYYEVSGELRGSLDETTKSAATAELQYLIDQMAPITEGAP